MIWSKTAEYMSYWMIPIFAILLSVGIMIRFFFNETEEKEK